VYETIVAAYDGSTGATDAVCHAAGLARLCDAELLIVTIYRHHGLLEASLAMFLVGSISHKISLADCPVLVV
jgi:nucleotide-binding universal stress UspA family protein